MHVRRPGSSARSEQGATLVEFAIVAPLLLLLMFGVIDFSRLFYSRLTIQHAVREAVRFAVTGNSTSDPDGRPRTRVESIRAEIIDSALGLDVDVNTIQITPPDGGAAGQVVTVRTDFSFEFATPLVRPFFPDGRYAFSVASSMKNEPFTTN